MKKFTILLTLFSSLVLSAQNADTKIPITVDNGERVMTGFETMAYQSDEAMFVNVNLFAIDSVCSVKKDMILSTDFDGHSMQFRMLVGSLPGSKLSNVYQVDVRVRIQDHRLMFFVNNMQVMPGNGVFSRSATEVNKLTPEKKSSHAEIIEDISQCVSAVIHKMIHFVSENKPAAVTHWDDVKKGNAFKGMSEIEAKLAFGKPQYVSENRGEVQWMYGSSFHLFFEKGKVTVIMK